MGSSGLFCFFKKASGARQVLQLVLFFGEYNAPSEAGNSRPTFSPSPDFATDEPTVGSELSARKHATYLDDCFQPALFTLPLCDQIPYHIGWLGFLSSYVKSLQSFRNPQKPGSEL